MIEGFRLGVFSRGATLWDGLDFAFGDAAAWFVAGPPSSGKTLRNFTLERGRAIMPATVSRHLA